MNHPPLIGISGSINSGETSQILPRCYAKAILAAGGIPVLLSNDMDDAMLQASLDRLDGILFSGGSDVDPNRYGEWPSLALGEVTPMRDDFEQRLINAAVARKMPVLGICRGIQIMNVGLGGSLWQDLPSQFRTEDGCQPMQHSQKAPDAHHSHEVIVEPGSRLAEILGCTRLWVNTFHHQAVKAPAPGLQVAAHATDGVIEAIVHEELPYYVGVQWHPERYFDTDEHAAALFRSFVEAAAAYRA